MRSKSFFQHGRNIRLSTHSQSNNSRSLEVVVETDLSSLGFIPSLHSNSPLSPSCSIYIDDVYLMASRALSARTVYDLSVSRVSEQWAAANFEAYDRQGGNRHRQWERGRERGTNFDNNMSRLTALDSAFRPLLASLLSSADFEVGEQGNFVRREEHGCGGSRGEATRKRTG